MVFRAMAIAGGGGVGIPAGGTTDQVLTKDSGTDYDVSWQDPTAPTPSDTGWVTLPSIVGGAWGIQYRCIDNVVTVIVDGSFASTSGTSDVISTSNLPSQYRPPTIARTGAYFSGYPGTLSITANGVVTALQQSGAGRASISATMTYVVPNSPSSSLYADEVLADNPFLYWRLGDASGTVATDSSGNGRTGAYTNGPTLGASSLLVSDTANKAVTFDGVNDWVLAAPSLPLPSSFSAECWIKTTTSTAGFLVNIYPNASADRVFLLQVTPVGADMRASFIVLNTSGTSATITQATGNVANGNAHHIVGTFSGGTLTLYVDGVSVGSTTLAGTVRTSTGDFFGVGGRLTSTVPFNGVIDEAAYYATALSSGRVAAHYAAGI